MSILVSTVPGSIVFTQSLGASPYLACTSIERTKKGDKQKRGLGVRVRVSV